MFVKARSRSEIIALRSNLAGLSAQVGLIRLERLLSRKYDANQPREPAGQPGGGRWVSDAPGGPADNRPAPLFDPDTTGSIGQSEPAAERSDTVTEDGSRVLTIRIRPNAQAEWDEQHTVVSPDGERTVFETSGLTQTIRDGETGQILARNTLTETGVEPEAFVQDAFAPTVVVAEALVAATLRAAGTLFAVLSARNSPDGTAVFAAPASEYTPNANNDLQGFWVGRVDQGTLDNACPRNGEVQALADETAARVKLSAGYLSPQEFGNRVHKLIEKEINDRHDPNFIAETSYDTSRQEDISYGTRGSIRLDVLEKSTPTTVCVYDHKTGDKGLTPGRAARIAFMVQKNFPEALRIIMIEIRPKL